jgi:hypothetical protein
MNEFLDEKDDGTAILSHFYLLTGCAGSLWLEGWVVFLTIAFLCHYSNGVQRPSRLLQYTGILALGVGDAVVSGCVKRFCGGY